MCMRSRASGVVSAHVSYIENDIRRQHSDIVADHSVYRLLKRARPDNEGTCGRFFNAILNIVKPALNRAVL